MGSENKNPDYFLPPEFNSKVYKILAIAELLNGAKSFSFGPQKDIDGDESSMLLTKETIEKFSLENLKEGDVICLTTDENGKVINVELAE